MRYLQPQNKLKQHCNHVAKTNFAKNDKIIDEYKLKMTDANGELKTNYDKKIDDLEKKNKELKIKLDQYWDTGDSTWELYKSKFNHDMDELVNALNDFTVNNKK